MTKLYEAPRDYLPLDRKPEPLPRLDSFEEHWANLAKRRLERAGDDRRSYNPFKAQP